MSGEKYDILIEGVFHFDYNLDNNDVDKLKSSFAERVSHIYNTTPQLSEMSPFRIIQWSKRKMLISVAFVIDASMTPLKLLVLFNKLYSIMQFYKGGAQELNLRYPYEKFWNTMFCYDVLRKSSLIDKWEYSVWKNYEVFADSMNRFLPEAHKMPKDKEYLNNLI